MSAKLEATRHILEAPDRWQLALQRYRAAAVGAPAVVLVPGFSCNRHFIDYDDRTSLARHLAREGFDAWVLELRGRGRSRPLPGCVRPNDWTFDDLARVDVPAAIGYVREHTAGAPLCWLGHSMGGMVLYAHLATASGRDLVPEAGVTLASPVIFPEVASRAMRFMGRALLAVPTPGRVPVRPAMGVMWHAVNRTRLLNVGMNPHNIDRRLVASALRRSLSNISPAKLRQVGNWSLKGTFESADGRIDYREGMRRVQMPMLLLAGAADRLVTPDSVRMAHVLLGGRGEEQRFQVLGREQGFSADYGHVDLVLGKRAPEEVFPLVARWIHEALRA